MRPLCSSSKPDQPTQKGDAPGLGLKAAWYGAEQLGNIIGAFNQRAPTAAPTQPATMSRADAVAAIRADYDENYFVSGKVVLSCLVTL